MQYKTCRLALLIGSQSFHSSHCQVCWQHYRQHFNTETHDGQCFPVLCYFSLLGLYGMTVVLRKSVGLGRGSVWRPSSPQPTLQPTRPAEQLWPTWRLSWSHRMIQESTGKFKVNETNIHPMINLNVAIQPLRSKIKPFDKQKPVHRSRWWRDTMRKSIGLLHWF